MKQREIWLVDLNPVKGSEQRGIRPVVIVSGNAMNDNLQICIVCPLSSKIKGYKGCLILEKDDVNGLDSDSEIITFQIRTVSAEHLVRKIGTITNEQMANIRSGLRDILTY
jgi:mRNA interferase MazF